MRYFVAVAEALSFTRGAEKLRIAQPSLTRQIKNLEEEIGVRLLDRTKLQVRLTPEGQSFLVDAKRVLELSEEIVESVQHFSRTNSPLSILATWRTRSTTSFQSRWHHFNGRSRRFRSIFST